MRGLGHLKPGEADPGLPVDPEAVASLRPASFVEKGKVGLSVWLSVVPFSSYEISVSETSASNP